MNEDASDDKAAACKEEGQSEPASASVLLVEDEALIAEIIGEVLMDHGYAVHAVASAEEALAHLSAGAPVDILFTDINLPGDMDGAMLAEEARRAVPLLPVIYASGRWTLLEKLRAQPLSAILQKPYSPARACEAVQGLLDAALRAQAEAGGMSARAMAI
jgi:CheY-like chemotaxis protein